MMIENCVYCNRQFDIDDNTNKNLLWPCEVCGDAFCEECFERVHGKEMLEAMTKRGAYIACPDCFPKYKHEILK